MPPALGTKAGDALSEPGDNLERGRPVTASTGAEDLRLVEGLRNREEAAFIELLKMYHPAMLRIAGIYVSSPALAEEVVQETWLSVLQGIDRFEGRSSLKTWIVGILLNRAKTCAVREGRSIPFSAMAEELKEPTVEFERFLSANDHWASPPKSWGRDAEQLLLARETSAVIQKAIDDLPSNQRLVITLRDVEGWTPPEVCNLLAISDTNQRVLLHRARAKVRRAFERYFERG